MATNTFIRDPRTAKLGEEILPLEVGYLPEYFQKKANAELGDSPERRAQGLQQLREMAKTDKLLKGKDCDDDFAVPYLLTRKFNIIRAFNQIKTCEKFRQENKQMFSNFCFETTVQIMTSQFISVLPRRCQDGCTIGLVETDNWNSEEFPFAELKKAILILIMQSLRDPMTQVNGFKAIFDVKGNYKRNIKYCTPKNLHLLYYGTQSCAPARYKEFHVVHRSKGFKIFWKIIKPLLSAKLKKRVHFHSTPETLLDFFPAAVLPVKYGGELEDYAATDWLRKVMSPEALKDLSVETSDT